MSNSKNQRIQKYINKINKKNNEIIENIKKNNINTDILELKNKQNNTPSYDKINHTLDNLICFTSNFQNLSKFDLASLSSIKRNFISSMNELNDIMKYVDYNSLQSNLNKKIEFEKKRISQYRSDIKTNKLKIFSLDDIIARQIDSENIIYFSELERISNKIDESYDKLVLDLYNSHLEKKDLILKRSNSQSRYNELNQQYENFKKQNHIARKNIIAKLDEKKHDTINLNKEIMEKDQNLSLINNELHQLQTLLTSKDDTINPSRIERQINNLKEEIETITSQRDNLVKKHKMQNTNIPKPIEISNSEFIKIKRNRETTLDEIKSINNKISYFAKENIDNIYQLHLDRMNKLNQECDNAILRRTKINERLDEMKLDILNTCNRNIIELTLKIQQCNGMLLEFNSKMKQNETDHNNKNRNLTKIYDELKNMMSNIDIVISNLNEIKNL